MTDKFAQGEQVEVIHKYVARSQNELSAEKLEILQVISCHDEWIYTRNKMGKQAMIPASYLRKKPQPQPQPQPAMSTSPSQTMTSTHPMTSHQPTQTAATSSQPPPPSATAATAATATTTTTLADDNNYRIDVAALRKFAREAEAEGHFVAIVIKDIIGKSPMHLTLSEGDFIRIVEKFPTGW